MSSVVSDKWTRQQVAGLREERREGHVINPADILSSRQTENPKFTSFLRLSARQQKRSVFLWRGGEPCIEPCRAQDAIEAAKLILRRSVDGPQVLTLTLEKSTSELQLKVKNTCAARYTLKPK